MPNQAPRFSSNKMLQLCRSNFSCRKINAESGSKVFTDPLISCQYALVSLLVTAPRFSTNKMSELFYSTISDLLFFFHFTILSELFYSTMSLCKYSMTPSTCQNYSILPCVKCKVSRYRRIRFLGYRNTVFRFHVFAVPCRAVSWLVMTCGEFSVTRVANFKSLECHKVRAYFFIITNTPNIFLFCDSFSDSVILIFLFGKLVFPHLS